MGRLTSGRMHLRALACRHHHHGRHGHRVCAWRDWVRGSHAPQSGRRVHSQARYAKCGTGYGKRPAPLSFSSAQRPTALLYCSSLTHPPILDTSLAWAALGRLDASELVFMARHARHNLPRRDLLRGAFVGYPIGFAGSRVIS